MTTITTGAQVTVTDIEALNKVNIKALTEQIFSVEDPQAKTNALIERITIPLYRAQGYEWRQQTLSVYNSVANHTVTQAEVRKLFLKKLKECAPKGAEYAVEQMWRDQEEKCRKKLEVTIRGTLSRALTDWDLSSAPMKCLIEIVKNNEGNWNEENKCLFYKDRHFPMDQMRRIVIECLNPIAQLERQAEYDVKENRYVRKEGDTVGYMYTADEIWSSDPVRCEENLKAACVRALKVLAG